MNREDLIEFLAEKLSSEYTRSELEDLPTDELEKLYKNIEE